MGFEINNNLNLKDHSVDIQNDDVERYTQSETHPRV